MPFLASEGCFWPLTASLTSEVKNNYAYVITRDICNKFIDHQIVYTNIEHHSIIKKKIFGKNTYLLSDV